MKISRLPRIVLALGAVLLSSALLAASGWAAVQVITDPAGDGEPGCDIVQATAAFAKGGLIEQTITTAEPFGSKLAAPWIQIYVHRGEINKGQPPPAELSTNGLQHVGARVTDEGKTIVYTIRRSVLRARAGIPKRQKRYFWVARACFQNPDYAPGAAAEYKPRVAAHAL